MELFAATIADISWEWTYFAVIVAAFTVDTVTIIDERGAVRYAKGIAIYQLRSLDHRQCSQDPLARLLAWSAILRHRPYMYTQ